MSKKISFLETDALKELGTMASGHAATALSKLIKRKIKINVPKGQIVNALEVPDILGGATKIVTVIFITIDSELMGALVLLLDQDNALKLANLMTKKNDALLTDFGVSSIKECGNICLNSYLNVLNEVTGIRISTSVPKIATNKMKILLDDVCLESRIRVDHALVLETNFQLNSTVIFGHFLFYLEADGFENILNGLEKYKRKAS